jgi:hypothetical protein
MNWWRISANINDYHSDGIEMSSTFWIPEITNWWRQQRETHSEFAVHINDAQDIFSVIPHDVAVEASSSLGQNIISWRQ